MNGDDTWAKPYLVDNEIITHQTSGFSQQQQPPFHGDCAAEQFEISGKELVHALCPLQTNAIMHQAWSKQWDNDD